jgi:hypothetical protein
VREAVHARDVVNPILETRWNARDAADATRARMLKILMSPKNSGVLLFVRFSLRSVLSAHILISADTSFCETGLCVLCVFDGIPTFERVHWRCRQKDGPVGTPLGILGI